jgi:hypothetical protein
MTIYPEEIRQERGNGLKVIPAIITSEAIEPMPVTSQLARSATLKHAQSTYRLQRPQARRSKSSNEHRRDENGLQVTIPSEPALPSPWGDFQSDDALNSALEVETEINLPAPISPIAGPERHVPPPPPAIGREGRGLEMIEKLRLEEDACRHEGVSMPFDGLGHLNANGNGNGNVSPGLVDWNPFLHPGLNAWTRESWGKRKVALISGITGQGKSHFHLISQRRRGKITQDLMT